MRSEPLHAADLGGTLFVPATHPQLDSVASGEKYPQLRSMVIDLEDGIDPAARETAAACVASMLETEAPPPLLRFIRPDSPEMLSRLLGMDGIGKMDGFVLPKFGLDNFDAWLQPLNDTAFALMPSIEGRELFNPTALHALADELIPYRDRIPAVRFGLEDMLRQLGIVRDCATPLYDLVAPAHVIGSFLAVFKPRGFDVSGGVYKCYADSEGFRREAETELRQGLLGKTIIHPSQIALMEEACKVTRGEKEQALKIMEATSNVASDHGIMLERPTQLPWAATLLRRAALYGVKA